MAHELLAKLNRDWKDYGLARPLDRCAAFIVDLVILYPIVQLIQAPFRHQLTDSIIFDQTVAASYWRLSLFFIFSIVFILYHGIGIGLYGQTLGRKFFGTRVIFISGEPNLVGGLARALLLYLEMLAFGLPWLAIFANRWRRPLHDRIVDSLVVSSMKRATYPSAFERQSAYLFTLSFAGFSSLIILTIAVYSVRSSSPKKKPESQWSHILEATCADFEDQHGLNMTKALEAFTLNRLSSDCLNTLASSALWKNQDKVLANLANALAFASEPEMSARYMSEVCELEDAGTPCEFVRWISKDPIDAGPFAEDIIALLKDQSLNDFYKIYFIAALQAHRDFKTAEQVIREIRQPQKYSGYLARATFINLLEQGRWDAAYWIFKSHQIGDQAFIDFAVAAGKKKGLARKKLKALLEQFYPQLNVKDAKRGIASTEEAPAAIKMLWIKLGDR